jgi:hypothetical protein
VLVAAVVLILLVALLAAVTPYVLGTEAARGMILDRINREYLSGRLTIQEWSFSWTGGIEMRGIELKDASDAHVLSVGELTSGFSMLRALRGHIGLGDTELSGVDFNLRRDERGELNLARLLKVNPNWSQLKLRHITGTIHFSGRTCTYEDDLPARHVLAAFDTIDGSVKISDINQPIETHLATIARVNGQTASLNLEGTISAIRNGLLDFQNLSGKQTISLNTGDSADLQASFEAKIGGALGVWFPSMEITRGQFDLRRLQEQGWLDLFSGDWLANNSVRINSGVMTVIKVNSRTEFYVDPIELTMNDGMGGTQTVRLPPLTAQLLYDWGDDFTATLILGDTNPMLIASFTGKTSGSARIGRFKGDLAELQVALGPVLPLILNSGPDSPLQLIAQNVIVATSGRFSAWGGGAWDGQAVSIAEPAGIAFGDLTVQQGGAATAIDRTDVGALLSGRFTISEVSDQAREFIDLERQLLTSDGILGELGVTAATPMRIDRADIRVQSGRVTQDVSLVLNGSEKIRVAGVVDLQTMRFEPMNVYVPRSLLVKLGLIGPSVPANLPDPVPVAVEGDAVHAKLGVESLK